VLGGMVPLLALLLVRPRAGSGRSRANRQRPNAGDKGGVAAGDNSPPRQVGSRSSAHKGWPLLAAIDSEKTVHRPRPPRAALAAAARGRAAAASGGGCLTT
jgi:hypothetical protein